ncbi:OmpW/AlkL family protein [Alteromonas oceanisediminis]|uniref:OmpW/AlkL family protein n=1 Tax=Alteromonas oceanisediminis TaxID=2836180 RepID=UPI001BD9203E|nr:OmpW family outer membrane protein [Alteromonas oceanisediminis]MBT0586648.1 outer membrane beta-barrel protein [Alteromonas oceanisediminis]
MKKSILAVAVATLFTSHLVVAYDKGDFVVRAGVTRVAPDEATSNVSVAGGDLGFGLNISNDTQLGLNVAYFFSNNLNVEVLAATPFTHDVHVNNNPLGLGKLGEVTHLPPTVTVNYFFNHHTAQFQPYVGAGLNYTFIYDEAFTDSNESLGFSDLGLDNSFGWSAQVGFDYRLGSKWLINASARYIAISTDATFTLNNAALGAANAPGSVGVDIDPFVYTVSVGYAF